ncbi:hypothetical protein ACFU5O_31805 [Streptomyces sp. NPDC057445]|uniref:hypothetical protein n=1 Tax=Streptomyces sp. NPDC057445 TaxID=3346136 RepID=UPI0036CB87F0
MTDSAAVPGFRPTHVVPGDGLLTWEAPDISRPSTPLDPFLPVELVDRMGEWGRVLCANGWSAWVDGRLLVAVPQSPQITGQPPARTADPRPLLARAEEALAEYRRAAESLASGHSDGETFRRLTHGMRVGMVVDGEALWLYDAEHERWLYCDGTRLATFATGSPPHSAPADGSAAVGAAGRTEAGAAGASHAPPGGPPTAAGHPSTRIVTPPKSAPGGSGGGTGGR